jgi:hypothetical protein
MRREEIKAQLMVAAEKAIDAMLAKKSAPYHASVLPYPHSLPLSNQKCRRVNATMQGSSLRVRTFFKSVID